MKRDRSKYTPRHILDRLFRRGKLSRRGGFTMMEMLIVLQIISALIATSIPLFQGQMGDVWDAYNAVAGVFGVQETAAQPVAPDEETALFCAHSWGPTQYKWSDNYTKCTAVSVCSNCKMQDKVSTKDISVSSTEAKCEEPGSATYTAKFIKPSLGDSVTVEIPALGHDWGEASYQWSAGNLQCTGTCVCKRCDKVETQTKTVNYNSTTATCEQGGIITGTAWFTAPFKPQTATTSRGALGHLWGGWTVVTPTCTQPGVRTRTCQRAGCGATVTVDAPALGHRWGEWTVVTEPTCTQPGVKTHTCQRAGCGVTETVDAEALGHDWGAVTYTWSADHGQCTAERACGRCGLGESATANALATGTPATCTEAGKTTYTAAFAAPFATQTATVDVPALGHTGGAATCTAKTVCARCGKEYGELGEHQWTEKKDGYEWERKIPRDGKEYLIYGHYKTCSVCETKLEVQDGETEGDPVEPEIIGGQD